MQAEQLQQAWRRASRSPDAPSQQQGLEHGGEGLHEARAVSAFQRSPAWTNEAFGAFKPVRQPARTPRFVPHSSLLRPDFAEGRRPRLV